MKTKTGLLLALSVTSARAADIGTTHYFLRGDMKGEANPLVRVAGFDWSELLLSNAIMTILILVGILFYSLGRTKETKEKTYTIGEFGGICLYNQKLSLGQLARRILLGWPLPKDWFQALRFLGYVTSYTVVAGSFAAVFAWWATRSWEWDWVSSMRSTLAIGYYSLFELVFGLGFGLLAMHLFLHSEMNIANKKTESNA